MPRLSDVDPADMPRFVTVAIAGEFGLTRDQVRHRVRRGTWRTVRRGLYERIAAASGEPAWSAQRAAFVARATEAARSLPDAVVSHRSAAILLGLPLVQQPPERVDLTVPVGCTTWSSKHRTMHVGRIDTNDTAVCEGVRVTSPQRTIIDIARLGNLGNALSVGDYALRAGMLDLDAVRAHVHHLPPRLRGRKHAVLAVSEISSLRESPLESWSWARFLEWGLPRPRMQVRIDDHGLLIGVVDFLWDDVHLIGECDGAMKYRQPGDLYREKRREDELRGLGFGVIRWGWSDAAEGARLRRRLERALSSATAHVA